MDKPYCECEVCGEKYTDYPTIRSHYIKEHVDVDADIVCHE